MKGISYISVILPLKLEWEPCYSVSEIHIKIGDRVNVRFAGRIYSGVVSATDIEPQTDPNKIKPIDSIEEGLERILPQEIELWRKVSEYYMCTIGEVYKAAYPQGKISLEEAHAAAMQRTLQKHEKLIGGMRQRITKIQDRLARKEELSKKSKDGTKIKAAHIAAIEKLRIELATAEDALRKVESNDRNKRPDMPALESKVFLTDTQQKAYDRITTAFSTGKPVMLHGVTGSGKTEIYIKAAYKALEKGRNVLYLVPEIALSRQLEERLQEHFGERLLTFHSAETAVSRRNTAESVRSGDGYVVLGTRSSLFLPHHDLGLIIVDEEHDSSYKQDSPAPRYNGRDTALMLSLIHGSNIILGSATPSLEEIYNCNAGKHELITLQERFHRSESSSVEIIDTKAERRKRGMIGNFSIKLITHIKNTLEAKGQVMILRSRRAWASAVQCEECGEIQKCPHCNVSMSLHKNNGTERLVCHYCGYSTTNSGNCVKCGGAVKNIGAGTQKIEEEAAALFPNARIARLDSDSAQNRSFESRTIKEFGKGEIDILIGTQMLTKGFDFERLSLTAVIAADAFLGMQDFRADEKALQLFEQFRGRCGRRENKGLFVIQTANPEHPVYKKIASGENSGPDTDLMMERRDFNFPPYTRIIEICFKDTNENRVRKMSCELAKKLQNHEMTGPYSPIVDKVADQHIRIIRLNLKKDRKLSENKKQIMNSIRDFEKSCRYDGHISINVDPS